MGETLNYESRQGHRNVFAATRFPWLSVPVCALELQFQPLLFTNGISDTIST
jgi:hypothetical protein